MFAYLVAFFFSVFIQQSKRQKNENADCGTNTIYKMCLVVKQAKSKTSKAPDT